MNLKRVVFPVLAVTLSLFCGYIAVGEESPLSLGLHFYELGNYDAAITEYKRFLFFDPDAPRAGVTYRNIGRAHREQGHWQEAIAAMRTAVQHASDREENSEFQLELAVLLIANQNYDLGRLELIKDDDAKPLRTALPTRAFLTSRCKCLPVSMGGSA